MYLWSGSIPSNTLGYALTIISHAVITLVLLVIKLSRSSTCCVDQCTDVVKPQKRWPLLRLSDLTLNIVLLFGALTMLRTKLPSRVSRSVLHIGSAPSGIATYTGGASHMHKHGMSYIGCPFVHQRHTLLICCQMYKIIKSLDCIDFNLYFSYASHISRHHSLALSCIHSRVNSFRYSFFVNTSFLWNSLSSDIVDCPSYTSFKSKLALFLLSQ